ncbi:MAG: PPC domain-containing protein [Armatimonadota bacterium]
MKRSPLHAALWTLAGTLLVAAPAAAQVPAVSFVHPSGGQAGTSAAVTVGGGNLQGATSIVVSGSGVEAAITKNDNGGALPVELKIAADAEPGIREIRVVTPRGTSNAGRIVVGTYPEAAEGDNGANNALATAQKLASLPVTVNGQVNGGEDVDWYTFEAAAGDTLVLDLTSFRMASALDGYLQLTDARGKSLASAQEAFDRDPRIIHTFKTAGTYAVAVRDSLFRGGGNFSYRLTVGKLPVVTGYLPLGGRPGETVAVRLEGVNLGGMQSMNVEIPAGQERVSVMPKTPMGVATTPVELVASNMAQVVEAEPNDAPAQATATAELPIALNGRIDKPGDVDLYRIKPAAAGTLTFDLLGRRIGSRIESFIRVLDAAGKELQQNDDAVGKDSRIAFGVQAGTEYLVEVRSQDRRAGGDVFYRLEIAPASGPDFRLSLSPDSINVPQGGSALITVNVERINGFNAAIPLKVEGLPAGVTASQAFIPAGANSAQFTVSAAADAAMGAMQHVKVIGTGTLGEAQVERVAQPFETYVPPLAAPEQARRRTTEFSVATVMNPQPYALALENAAVTLKRGQSVEVKIRSTRQMGQNAQIAVTVAGQPGKVTPEAQPIPQDQNEAVLKITAAGDAPLGTVNLIISGNLSNNVQVAPALTLTVVE